MPDLSSSAHLSRRDLLAGGLALGASSLSAGALAQAAGPLMTRAIPHGGEKLPVVGLGTAINFASDDAAKRAAQNAVIETLLAGGGRLVDTASSYGEAESVLGTIFADTGARERIFLATKVRVRSATESEAEFKRSLQRLRTAKVDLIQLHNVARASQSLAQLRAWKAAGLARYVGITSTAERDYAAVEAIIRREKPDFVQVDYSMENREAEKRIIPTAADNGAAVLTALPFGRNSLFRAVKGKTLPEWSKDFDAATWAQFFLKFLLGNTQVTAVIPGTGNAEHMADNLAAGRGPLPDAATRERMAALLAG